MNFLMEKTRDANLGKFFPLLSWLLSKPTKHCYINYYLTIKVFSVLTLLWVYSHFTMSSPSKGQNVFEFPVHGGPRLAGDVVEGSSHFFVTNVSYSMPETICGP